eukprot:4062646-Amphidinium_carterae.1
MSNALSLHMKQLEQNGLYSGDWLLLVREPLYRSSVMIDSGMLSVLWMLLGPRLLQWWVHGGYSVRSSWRPL